MKGLKIIPLFVGLIVLSYLGVVFVEANRGDVMITFGSYQSAPTAVGFVVLTSILFGMILAGMLCFVEIAALYLQTRRLRRRIELYEEKLSPTLSNSTPSDRDTSKVDMSAGELG